jgi:hypothetical protein
VYPTTQLLNGVAFVSRKNEGNGEINCGNCSTASRPDRITPVTHWIIVSNDKNGVYPTTQLLNSVAFVSRKMKELDKLIMEMVSQFQAPTALPPLLIGSLARMIRMECNPPQIY